MNKTIKIVFNLLIGAAALAFLIFFTDMCYSFEYANRELPDPAKNDMLVFEYELEHKAYGEVIKFYFTDRMQSMEAPAGIEATYLVGEYANTAFLKRMYAEKKDAENERSCQEKLDSIRAELGEYLYTADEIDEIIRKAP